MLGSQKHGIHARGKRRFLEPVMNFDRVQKLNFPEYGLFSHVNPSLGTAEAVFGAEQSFLRAKSSTPFTDSN
jgi:hypothetical protein